MNKKATGEQEISEKEASQQATSNQETKATRLLQGYIWYPKDADVNLSTYLPSELEGGIHLLWDEVRPPFAFFDDGTLAATQHIYQFTALTLEDNPEGLTPWLAEVLQEKLETTPAGVGWQLMEDLREL